MFGAVPCDLPDDVVRSQFGCASVIPRINYDTTTSTPVGQNAPSTVLRTRQRCRLHGEYGSQNAHLGVARPVSHANGRACCCPLRHNSYGAKECAAIRSDRAMAVPGLRLRGHTSTVH